MIRAAAGAFAAAASLHATPVPAIQAGELVRLQTNQRVVALTFDGGSTATGTASILRTLWRERVPATFFLTGRWAELYPRLARTIGASYRVGNHTETHRALPTLSDAEGRREILEAQGRLRAATGRDPRPLFRFPYGSRDARTIRLVHALGYVSVRWTVDTLGWMGESRTGIVRRVGGQLQPGEIVLLHLGAPADARALPAVIALVRARGYRFVTLAGVHA